MPEVTPICQFGTKAIPFSLGGIDEKTYNLKKIKGKNGTLVIFICNHCPYVKAIAKKIAFETNELKKLDVQSIAVMSNDTIDYPEDSFDNMKKFAKNYNFQFPYLIDDSQTIAKQYNAICTPDFYGFNKNLELHYRGRIDSGVMENNKDINRELYFAMEVIVKSNIGPKEQFNSYGCSIKWKNENKINN